MRPTPIVLGLLIALGSPAEADSVVTAGRGGTQIDWTRGLVLARVVAPADRHAPSPAVARSGARRAAEDRAREHLLAAARALPWAKGGTVGDQIDARSAAAALARAVDRARVVASDYFTDGSVRVELALPIEAVRLAIAGPRRVGAAAPAGPTAIVVDARGLKLTPAVGLGVAAGTASLQGPVIFSSARPDADVLGARPLDARAIRHPAGVLTVDALDAAAAADALVVVLVAGPRARPR